MTTLLRAMQTRDSLTTNGMATNSSSLNSCVDLFFQFGAMRGKEKSRLISVFTKAYAEDPLTAMKLLFWVRDIRGGAGERQIFKDIIQYLADNRTDSLAKNLHLVSEFGRWDDLLVLFGTRLESAALALIASGLADKNGLACKWMPRPNTKNKEAKAQAVKLYKYLNLTPKAYRKLLVENSNTVEQLMCSKSWDSIDYAKLPSKAMSDLMKTFSRHDGIRFGSYLTSLEKGETKINASAVYPYDIVKNLRYGDSRGANAQWLALPNYMEGNKERLLPMVDVSGSMSCSAGSSQTVSCLDVAMSLGVYISERNVGPFKDAFITFTSQPTLQYLRGSLSERLSQLRGPVGYDTNIQAAFEMLLKKAVESKVAPEEMPTMIVVLSDMEFNSGSVRGWTAQDMVEALYAKAGYEMPKLVYWNLHSRNDSNKPVHFDTYGSALISGFSPSILTSLLAGKEMSPYSMMMTVVDSERYQAVRV
jgi:hypothetical protein